MKKFQIVILHLLIFLIALPSTYLALEPNQPAPTFIGKFMNGSGTESDYYSLSLNPDKIRVLNLFWTECIPCRKEIPEIATLEKKFPAVEFILANVFQEDEAVVKNFLKGLSAHPSKVVISSPVIRRRFKRAEDSDLLMPTTIIIGAGNRIIKAFYGYDKKLIENISTILMENE